MIDFDKTFGQKETKSTNKPASDLPKAEFWLNIGYTAEGAGKDGEDAFVSLPQGIPLDTQEPLSVKGKNSDWVAFQSARNGLLKQIMQKVSELQPGEETLLNLQVQVRRVNNEEMVIDPADNKFTRSLDL
ncbi:hypothetical protein Ea92_02 [Erwinia phage Ea9-2]|uniref:Uncharacterized protein n=1 Tax=Erwinia phage Ea9-2 TaxID=1429767 RepID=W6AQQ8_9CAUD|nr:hypothetical protein Ea92_02 [Erwinia phage Ea9-2]AHI60058.1 hypothetical protein Ea92_02 [Erwinia phage Ea9-2]